MTTTQTTTTPHGGHDTTEELAVAGLGLGILARTGELAFVLLLGLVFCPPLAILAVAVVVPTLILVGLVALVCALCAVPVLLVRHVREHHRTHHTSALAHGLRVLRARHA
jgi:uncharacterized membrane-anchored protein